MIDNDLFDSSLESDNKIQHSNLSILSQDANEITDEVTLDDRIPHDKIPFPIDIRGL